MTRPGLTSRIVRCSSPMRRACGSTRCPDALAKPGDLMSTSGYTYDDHLPADFSDQSLRTDVATGLTAARKWLPPKWFYDKIGSELFEDITRLREYYPTRTERAILDRHASEIIEAAGSDTLIELGSGSSEKTTLLLDALTSRA